jgi:hypothetical protein
MSVRTTFRAGGHRRPHAVGSGAGVRWEVAWGWVLTASSIRARRASWSRCESSMLLSDSSVRVGTHGGETLELETHAAAGMACSGEHGGRVRLHGQLDDSDSEQQRLAGVNRKQGVVGLSRNTQNIWNVKGHSRFISWKTKPATGSSLSGVAFLTVFLHIIDCMIRTRWCSARRARSASSLPGQIPSNYIILTSIHTYISGNYS